MGWNPSFQADFVRLRIEGSEPAHVAVVHRDRFRVLTGAGERDAVVSGKFRHESQDWPATGDWVALRDATIHALVPRRTRLVREEAKGPQVIAANVDLVFVMTSLDRDFNPRRLERALTIVADGAARAVILLTKSDLAPDPSPQFALLPPGVPALAVSALTGDGLAALEAHLTPGTTVALLGSSGVGKSSLLNRLLGNSVQETAEVRADDQRGRHTTTRRELFLLPGGAMVIDTPGLREIGIGDADPSEVFAEIAERAAACRFRDCRHEQEPGCAVRASVDPDRLRAFDKLRREQAYEERRGDVRARQEERKRWARIHRELRQRPPKGWQ